MNRVINKLPLPIAGLMLGLAALGNLLGGYSLLLKNILGIVSGMIAILILVKIIKMPKSLKDAFDNPVAGSVMATLPMGLMLLSTYLKPYISTLALVIWLFSLVMHVVFIIVFTKKYLLNFNIKKVFPSYFVMYVGIVCASVTSPAYQMQTMGQLIFWFGLVSYLALLPVVIYRVIKIKAIPAPAIPTLIIFAAPASLCLTGYLKAFSDKSPIMIYCLAGLASIMVIYALLQMPKMLKLPFVPAYSAFTFPFVISAIAATGFTNFMTATNHLNPIYPVIKDVLTVFASLMVLYVLIRYTTFLIASPNKNNKQVNKVG